MKQAASAVHVKETAGVLPGWTVNETEQTKRVTGTGPAARFLYTAAKTADLQTDKKGGPKMARILH